MLALWTQRKATPSHGWSLVAALLLALVGMASAVPVVNLLAVVLILSTWAWVQRGNPWPADLAGGVGAEWR